MSSYILQLTQTITLVFKGKFKVLGNFNHIFLPELSTYASQLMKAWTLRKSNFDCYGSSEVGKVLKLKIIFRSDLRKMEY
jgi:hypothetical protein